MRTKTHNGHSPRHVYSPEKSESGSNVHKEPDKKVQKWMDEYRKKFKRVSEAGDMHEIVSLYFDEIRTELERSAQKISEKPTNDDRTNWPSGWLLLEMMRLHNDEGLSLKDAAEQAGILGFSDEEPPQPPLAKARRILKHELRSSFPEDQEKAEQLYQEFEKLCPVTTDSIAIDPHSIVEHAEAIPMGFCWKISLDKDVKEIELRQDSQDLASMSVKIKANINRADYHQKGFNGELARFQKGELFLLDPQKIQRAGFKVEAHHPREKTKYLVGLRVQSDNRIYGEYDAATGELTIKGIIDKHTEWTKFIQNYAR